MLGIGVNRGSGKVGVRIRCWGKGKRLGLGLECVDMTTVVHTRMHARG